MKLNKIMDYFVIQIIKSKSDINSISSILVLTILFGPLKNFEEKKLDNQHLKFSLNFIRVKVQKMLKTLSFLPDNSVLTAQDKKNRKPAE